MGKDTPETPDFTKLAEQMGLTSRQNVIEQAFANRPDIYTPFGNVTWDRPAYEYPSYLNSGSGSGTGSTGGTGSSGPTYNTGDGSGGTTRTGNPESSMLTATSSPLTVDRGVPAPDGYVSPPRTGPVPGSNDTGITPTPRPGETTVSPRGDTPPYDPNGPTGPGGYPVAPYPGTNPVDPGSLDPGTGYGPATGGGGLYNGSEWAMHLNLPPDMQAALNAQQDITRGRSEFGANTLMGDAYNDYNSNRGFWNALGQMSDPALARNRAEDAIYQRASSRLDPQWGSRESQLQTQLANQGLTPGSTAYTNQMRDFNLGRNDAYQTAMNEAIMGGGAEASRQQAQELQARQQGISEGYQQQYGGLNALNAFLGGQQVGMPGMPSFNSVGMAQTPNYLGAGQAQYGANLNASNMQNAAMNNLMGGASQMAGMLPFMM